MRKLLLFLVILVIANSSNAHWIDKSAKFIKSIPKSISSKRSNLPKNANEAYSLEKKDIEISELMSMNQVTLAISRCVHHSSIFNREFYCKSKETLIQNCIIENENIILVESELIEFCGKKFSKN